MKTNRETLFGLDESFGPCVFLAELNANNMNIWQRELDAQESVIQLKNCPRCKEKNSSASKYCCKCGNPLDAVGVNSNVLYTAMGTDSRYAGKITQAQNTNFVLKASI